MRRFSVYPVDRNSSGNDASPAPSARIGSSVSSAPPSPWPRPDAVSYAVEIISPDDAFATVLQSASNLYRLRQQPPQNGEGLARRASADLPRLVDALWAEGYYDASARATIDGHVIQMGGAGIDAAAAAADADINRRVAQVRLDVHLGELYRIGAIKMVNRDPRTRGRSPACKTSYPEAGER